MSPEPGEVPLCGPSTGDLTEKEVILRPADSWEYQVSFTHQKSLDLHLVPGIRLSPGAKGLVGTGPLGSVVKNLSSEVEQTWLTPVSLCFLAAEAHPSSSTSLPCDSLLLAQGWCTLRDQQTRTGTATLPPLPPSPSFSSSSSIQGDRLSNNHGTVERDMVKCFGPELSE